MRKIDMEKSNQFGKAPKTINFDRHILKALEDRASKEGTTASNLINTMCKQYIVQDAEYNRMMAKEHFLKFQEYKYLTEQAEILVEVKK